MAEVIKRKKEQSNDVKMTQRRRLDDKVLLQLLNLLVIKYFNILLPIVLQIIHLGGSAGIVVKKKLLTENEWMKSQALAAGSMTEQYKNKIFLDAMNLLRTIAGFQIKKRRIRRSFGLI